MNESLSPGNRHIPSLDGLRGLAILLVIAFHYFATTPIFVFGWTGVDLFFVLSGYLITGRLLTTLGRPGYFTTFYRNRILRIFPLYFGTLLIFFLGIRFLAKDTTEPLLNYYLLHWKSFFLFTENWTFIRYDKPAGPWLTHFWSLAVEEQFYLFWPLFIYYLQKTKPRQLLFTFIFLLIIAVRCTWFYFQPHPGSTTFFYFNTFFRMDSLVLGALLAQLHLEKKLVPRNVFAPLFVISGLALTISFIFLASPQPWHPFFETIGYSLIAVFAACLIHQSVAYPNSLLTRVFSTTALKFIGKISFGLYVIHFPVYQIFYGKLYARLFGRYDAASHLPAFFSVTGCLLLTFILACISYFYFERPFLRLKKHAASTPARPTVAP